MHESWGLFIQILTAVVSLLCVVGAAFASVTKVSQAVSRLDVVVVNLKDTVCSLKKHVDRLDQEGRVQDTRLTRLETSLTRGSGAP